MSAILEQRGFLSPLLCRRLIRFFDDNIATLGIDDLVPSFSHRVISYPRISEAQPEDAQVKRAMRAARFIVGERIAEYFGADPVLPEKTQLVIWPSGTHQGLHRDVTRPTTTYAAIIYLNDDYEGGETFFPEHAAVVPETGKLVAFHGIREPHGVAMVRSGTRYTMPMWFTDSPNAIEA